MSTLWQPNAVVSFYSRFFPLNRLERGFSNCPLLRHYASLGATKIYLIPSPEFSVCVLPKSHDWEHVLNICGEGVYFKLLAMSREFPHVPPAQLSKFLADRSGSPWQMQLLGDFLCHAIVLYTPSALMNVELVANKSPLEVMKAHPTAFKSAFFEGGEGEGPMIQELREKFPETQVFWRGGML